MDENRINQRFRPRPYDLRRKVLLKNFLREQMTYIPTLRRTAEVSLEVDGDSNSNNSTNPTPSVENEENIGSSNGVLENDQPIPTNSKLEQISSSSTSDDDCANDSAAPKDAESIPPTKFSLVSSIFKLRGSSRKKRKKGITKAKHVYKNINKPNALFVPNSTTLKPEKRAKKKRTFGSFFKSRKEKKNKEKIANASQAESFGLQSAPPVDSIQTTSQSVQTDMSWSNSNYDLEQSYKCLQEENRLLSENLSSMISDRKCKPCSVKEQSVLTDSYCSTESKASKPEAPSITDRSIIDRNPSERIAQRSRLLRSKSVQEKCNIPKTRSVRTRSMNFPGTLKYANHFSPGQSSRDSYSNQSRFTSVLPPEPQNSLPQQQSPVLKNLPVNSSRTIVRRSSLPGRTTPHESMALYRFRPNDGQNSTMYRYPHCAPYPPLRPPALRSLSINNFGKSLVRRSSMPERTPRNYDRSLRTVHRHHSINDRDKYSNRYVSDNNRSVPFQNLPNEAFY